METVISKRHPVKFYLPVLGCFIFLSGCSAGTLYLVFNNNNNTGEKLLLGCGISILFLLLGFYVLITYFINAPVIAISKNSISFNEKECRVDDIVEIAYTGKQPFKYHPAFALEGAKIVFSKGETKYILDKMYSNTPLLKMSLQSIYTQATLSPRSDLKKFDDTEPVTYYKRNPLLSFNGIFLFGSIVMFTTFCSLGLTVLIFLMFLTMFLVAYLIFSYQLHYFGVSENYIIIKNFARPWVRASYSLTDIKEVVFEKPNELTISLRIITCDYGSVLYPASSLMYKDWRKLKSVLEEKGLKVRNEYPLI